MKSLQDLEVLVEIVAAKTGLSSEEISSQLASANIQSFKMNDMILVSPEDFGAIIDAWANTIKTSLGLGSSVSTKTVAALETDDEAIALSWPEGYEKVVNHQYGPSLKKILPQDLALKRAYLEAIAHESQAGIALVEELAKVIARKYGGPGTLSPEKAMAGVIKKANMMLAEL